MSPSITKAYTPFYFILEFICYNKIFIQFPKAKPRILVNMHTAIPVPMGETTVNKIIMFFFHLKSFSVHTAAHIFLLGKTQIWKNFTAYQDFYFFLHAEYLFRHSLPEHRLV